MITESEKQVTYNPQQDESGEQEITVNLKKIIYAVYSRRLLFIRVFTAVLLFFIFLTFISPKKYTVSSDLYINTTNNTNMRDINPYLLSSSSSSSSIIKSGGLTNEIELMKSPLVMDKVIRENHLVYGKKFGIIPNKREGEYISTQAFLGKGKNPLFREKKGTNVISITYQSKNPELARNIVNSIIKNYIELLKRLNSEKSNYDKELIENEYAKAKLSLEKKINEAAGLPEQALAASGSLSAMSAFSRPAQKAMSVIKGQVTENKRSNADIGEEAAKVSDLSSKLEWAKMVDKMSKSSNVVVLKEPDLPRKFEYSSPKWILNILLGLLFGIVTGIFAIIYAELTDTKITYSMLSDEVIYDIKKDFSDLKVILLANKDKNISLIAFENIPDDILSPFGEFKNLNIINAAVTSETVYNISKADKIILFVSIGKTSSKLYNQINKIIKDMNKKVIQEVLLS